MRSGSPSRYLGLGHIAFKSPQRASAAPGQGNHSEFLPGRFPAPPQRPCQGVGANSVARPAAGASAEGPSLELAPASSFTCLVADFLRVIFFPRSSGRLTPVSWLALSRGLRFLWTPCAKNCLPPLTSLLPTVFKQRSSSGLPSLPLSGCWK